MENQLFNPAALPHYMLPYYMLSYYMLPTTCCHTTCCHTTCCHTTCCHITCCHTICCHTTCCHTICCHTTRCHTTCCHTTHLLLLSRWESCFEQRGDCDSAVQSRHISSQCQRWWPWHLLHFYDDWRPQMAASGSGDCLPTQWDSAKS